MKKSFAIKIFLSCRIKIEETNKKRKRQVSKQERCYTGD